MASLVDIAQNGVTVHSLVKLVAGDEWQFNATLNDAAGQPIDLSNSTVTWSVVNFNGVLMFASTDFTVDTSAGNGQCSIVVPGTSSTKLPGGSYNDFWRVTDGNGVPTTLIQGPMRVTSDPFVAPHSWDFKGMTVQTGVKWNDTQADMANRVQEKVVYDFTS